jgi:hypothetical protein
MAVTRRNPKVELHAALGHIYPACLAMLLAWGLFHYRIGIEQLLDDLQTTTTWQGLPLVSLAAGVAATIGIGFTAAAIRRLGRWLTARRHLRMLKDPQQAALVPPLPTHLGALEPSTGRVAWNSVGYLLFSAALLAGVAFLQFNPDSNWDADPFERGVAWAVTVVLFFASVYGLFDSLHRWRLTSRAERLSRDRALAGNEQVEQPLARASQIPPLEIVFPVPHGVDGRELVHVTAERNVFGGKPWNIAYLRLFANETGLQSFLKGAWRECGYIHFLRDVDSVSVEELDAIAGAQLLINSRSRLLADLDSRPSDTLPRGTRAFAGLAAKDVEVEDEYGSYPVYAPLCHESFWKVAIDVLLDRADVVVLDLSGYHWDNLGTGYELQRVIDRFPIERTILLADPTHTDRPFLVAQIQRAWSQMAAGSPNAGERPRHLIVGQVGALSADTSRALAAPLQERLDATTPAVRADSLAGR